MSEIKQLEKAMSSEKIETMIETVVDETPDLVTDEVLGDRFSLLGHVLVSEASKEFIPPWWSAKRDQRLREFYKLPGAGHISSAVGLASTKLSTIPARVVAKDPTISSHVEEAKMVQDILYNVSEFGYGFDDAMEKFYLDLVTTDNGAFLEIMGMGREITRGDSGEYVSGGHAGPVHGITLGVRHLDSTRCQRTSDPIWPVVYLGDDGKRYKLHRSRVIFTSQMKSPDRDMHGVGYCSLSRAIDASQALMDLMLFRRERMGSRIPSKIVLGKGIPAEDIANVFKAINFMSDQKMRARFGGIGVIGSKNEKVSMSEIDLTSMEGFDEKTIVTLNMYAIAVAFGLDISELWPTQSSSSDDAKLGHLRSRGRLPAQITAILEREFNSKYLPPHLKMVFDFQDDQEDHQKAIVRDIRARNSQRYVNSRVMTQRASRKQMLIDKDITREQFIEMELHDGRLEDGAPIESLFFSKDQFIADLVDIGTDDIYSLDETYLDVVRMKKSESARAMAEESSTRNRGKAKLAWRALDWAEKKIVTPVSSDELSEMSRMAEEEEGENAEIRGPFAGRGSRNSSRT